jgi:hypothetical protein
MSVGVQADMYTAAVLTSVLPPPLHSQVSLLSMSLSSILDSSGNPRL